MFPFLRQGFQRLLGKAHLQLLDTRRLPFGFSVTGDLQLAGFQRDQPITLFDVGANHGDFAFRLAREWPQARVWAFEPSLSTFSSLKQRLAASPTALANRIHPCQLALGAAEQTGRAVLHEFGMDTLSSLHPSTAYTASHGLPALATSTVDCLSGADFCQQHGIASIDLLKVDTEGNHLQVLSGFQSLLGAGKIRAVLVEFNQLVGRSFGSSKDATVSASATSLMDLAQLLEPLGFILFTVHTDYVERSRGLGVWNALFVHRAS